MSKSKKDGDVRIPLSEGWVKKGNVNPPATTPKPPMIKVPVKPPPPPPSKSE